MTEALEDGLAEEQIVIASIKSKMHAIGPGVVEGLQQGIELAEQQYKGLVIWSGDEPFSAGADLQSMLPAFMIAGVDAIEGAEHELQQLMLRLRYAGVPVVSAVRGLALGGGCELAVHSARRVVAQCTWFSASSLRSARCWLPFFRKYCSSVQVGYSGEQFSRDTAKAPVVVIEAAEQGPGDVERPGVGQLGREHGPPAFSRPGSAA